MTNDGAPSAWRSIVTGAETALGQRVATALAERGSTVDLIGADEAAVMGTANLLRGAGPRAIGRVEVADPVDVRSVAEACARLATGAVHALVHAGIYAAADQRADSRGVPWLTTVNMTAPYVATRALAGALRQTPYGRVIFLSPAYLGPRLDVAGLRTGDDTAPFAYATYKARTVLAIELARRFDPLSSRIVALLSGIQPGSGASPAQIGSYRRGLRGGKSPVTRWFVGAPAVDRVARTAASLAMAEPLPGSASQCCMNSPNRWRKLSGNALDPSLGQGVWNLCGELSAEISLPEDPHSRD
jgi:NAD(P)-dependent dehydrogenase (short-subunit alcohol dehydrogenase family)